MNPNWRSFLESTDAVIDGASNEILHFGDAAAELKAAQTLTVLVPLTHLGQILATGDDTKTFLHTQFTSDINHLGAEQVQHSAWCTAKGRMQASFLIWRDGDNYQLALAADLQEATQKRLQMFVLRAKVKLTSLNESKVLLGLAGPQAAEALANAGLPCPAASMTSAATNGIQILAIEAGRYIISAPFEAMPALWQKLSNKARPAGLPVWRWLDIENAFPLVTLATKEEFVPQMADFEKLGGVSFHKGCYPGQEIVARTQYLGKVKRHLFRLKSNTPMQAGSNLYSPDYPDQACGMVVSAAASPNGGFVALAVVQSNFAASAHLDSREGPLVEAVAVNP
ncbi:MAG: folate-binding protein YgfZ [Dechloromonas sp.]|uniref:Folate-binding protein YgfZ n=1 Tax=Candidatus Dechloromonas phosphorivorans TaxID=2899244 RepID=A0A935K4J0_9RHOO|nr:folate-binding protein YgfZ [Candidatus Dechloromonas phosphorivorans]